MLSPDAFVKKYAALKANERSAAQTHFNDLCELLGVPKPLDYDPAGVQYRFEKKVLKVAGGKGFADVWWNGKFAVEYKGKGADLQKAYGQLLSYREDLGNPPLLLVSDMQTIEVHTNFTGTQKVVHVWKLDDLLNEEKRAHLRKVWTEPASFNPSHRIEEATVGAVASLARISATLKERGEDPERLAHFLVRLMFTLFAEDVHLIPRETFKRLIEAALESPEDFKPMCEQLFAAMKTGGLTIAGRIPYINGGVFEDTSAPDLKLRELQILHDASKRNWRQIDPTIFGTLFELVINPRQRWQLGAHYTPLVDILDVVEPVIMRPLRAEWEALRAALQPLMEEIEEARRTTGDGGLYADGGLGQAQVDEAVARLSTFQDRLAAVTVLDPAMGSGNFLYVTMRLLLDLELEVRSTTRTLTQDLLPEAKVSPRQFLGMEVNEYAHEIAGMVLWIGYLQWMREHDEKRRATPVLEKLPGLVHGDALFDWAAGAARTWPEAEFIVGNPPFLGNQKQKQAFGEDYIKALRKAFSGRISERTDLVCYWFELARESIVEGRTKRVGLISTSSIKSGLNVEVLKKIVDCTTIFLAWPDRPWIQDGADVKVSIVGFGHNSENHSKILYYDNDISKNKVEKVTKCIKASLDDGVDILSALPLVENRGLAFQGVTPSGLFVVPGAEARAWLDLPNPDGNSNTDVLKPYITGEDLMNRSSDRWIVDFNNMSLTEAECYRRPMEHVRMNVLPARQSNNRKSLRERWWLAGESQQAMRQSIHSLKRYLVTSRVSVYRIFEWLSSDSLPSNKLTVIALDDSYHYGILNSTIHIMWANSPLSGKHGVAGDLVYNHSKVFETFPFPKAKEGETTNVRKASEYLEKARAFLKKKDVPGRKGGVKLGLTDMYNLLSEYRVTKVEKVAGLSTLADAHAMLDQAVAAAYGWEWPLSEDEVLARLLALNLERSAAES